VPHPVPELAFLTRVARGTKGECHAGAPPVGDLKHLSLTGNSVGNVEPKHELSRIPRNRLTRAVAHQVGAACKVLPFPARDGVNIPRQSRGL